jgi:hypothetical protein
MMARHLPPNAHAYRLYLVKEHFAAEHKNPVISEDRDSGTFFRAASTNAPRMRVTEGSAVLGVSIHF